ncbi:hypothetical protein [Hydrogenophaga sp.]|uniref:hypothetical protein n=1 Tax=Hydrogenophaga sp. TaxID=1904254 RepID=UPI003F6DA091
MRVSFVPPVFVPPRAAPAVAVPGAAGTKAPLTSQFEQLLVRQLLTQVRASGLSPAGEGASAVSGYQAIADDHLAQLIASVGGLGLGAALSQTLIPPAATPGAAGPSPLIKEPPTAVNPSNDPLLRY